ncbi:MAG TPA: LuxR C-terminal-related transcriptional regulator [Euzebyales bacterium]|nr:LuxR C-terminal-related transcriptional regulator [Euzebyales bacterium]
MEALAEILGRARDAYARCDWPTAYHGFTSASEQRALSADDLFALADAAWWMGLIDEAVRAGEQAYRAYREDGRRRAAAMAALEVGLALLVRGDELAGTDWVGRCAGLLSGEPDGAEQGFLLFLTEVLGPLNAGRPVDERAAEALVASARRVLEVGRAHEDPTLVALGLLGEGRALLKVGQASAGTACLDQVMTALQSDTLLPGWAGELYCQLMAAAHEAVDLQRLRRLAALTTRWLERLPVAALYTGLCRVHRSQVLQVAGDWRSAEQHAGRACAELADIAPAGAAEAHYQLGEVRRLRGDLTAAERAYRQAHRLGRDPQPGRALLRLAQGDVRAAVAAIGTALVAAAGDRLLRARLRAAQVEIAVAAGAHDVADVACTELEDIAGDYGTAGLEAMADHARGLCLLAGGRREEALPVLRRACRRWQDLDAPYECARVRALLARVYRALGDADTAALELDAAATVFEQLGAESDLRAVDHLRGERVLPAGLTAREAEVLAQVAQGGSNRRIAGALFISDKTVARHLSNIFAKLGVTSRAAAAAYAVEHGLVPRADGADG